MKKRFRYLLQPLTVSLATSLAAIPVTHADQPHAVDWKPVTQSVSGYFQIGHTPGGDDQVLVQLHHEEKTAGNTPLLVTFPQCAQDPKIGGKPLLNLDDIIGDPSVQPEFADSKPLGPRWEMCTDRQAILLYPGDTADLKVSVDFLRPVSEGMSPRVVGTVYQVPWRWARKINDADKLARYKHRVHPAAEVTIDLYYRLDGKRRKWRAGNYEAIFGSASQGPAVTRDYYKVNDTMPVDVDDYKQIRRLPRVAVKPSFELPLKEVYDAGSGSTADKPVGRAKTGSFTPTARFDRIALAAHGAVSHTLSGKFSTKWSIDHSLHPGFGFRVEAWTLENGYWEKLASDWVQYNGTWTLEVPASKGFRGDHLRILYRSYNRYYRPQNQDGDTYSWRDPDQYDIGSSFDAGHRYADTDGGEYNSVGELVDAAMNMWSRLYWAAEIDPVPSEPLKFHFPNTWYNCGGTSPWSCANTSGEIWLIAAHGREADTVVHEMAHQLNNKFWNNKRPAGSGGSHTLNGCYPTRVGMALREGFANFMAAWVGYPGRNVADGNFDDERWTLAYDAEQRTAPPACDNGWENEVWVARTFWDLHDKHSDGDDILWFIHKGAVISLYLGNGVANDGDAMDMRDFETIYRNAATSGHEGFISDIFEQNRM